VAGESIRGCFSSFPWASNAVSRKCVVILNEYAYQSATSY
jgi:hypothetical protein